uniref:peroxidase n=1 Tax=Globodera pallida TaxID=36090 RepID=A0A183BVU6_GLOPA
MVAKWTFSSDDTGQSRRFGFNSSLSRRRRRTNAPKLLLAVFAVAFALLDVCNAQLASPTTRNFRCFSNGCCDQHEWCRFWASIGECQSNADWMALNCQLACSTCSRPNFPSAPPPRPPPPPPPAPAPAPIRPFSAEVTTTMATTQPPRTSAERKNTGPIAGSCDEISRNPSTAADQLIKSGLLNPIEDSRQSLSLDDITRAVSSGCVPETSTGDCSRSLCYHLSFRSMDGVCNNLRRPVLGASFRPYLRHLPSEYANGFSEPASARRPTAREASRQLLASAQVVSHDQINSILMQWGQFISHDMARTTLQPTVTCVTCDPIPSKCVPVPISDQDTNSMFRQKGCLKISRSAPVCGTGVPGKPREQLNENTAFVDGSQIYGSSSKDLFKFRDGRTGFLKLSRFNNMMVLPFDDSRCASLSTCTASFVAGDIRANLFLGLSSMHIIFAREHNRVARSFQSMNSGWSGDRLFQEARKIVGAEIQAILYKEFLPRVLGSTFDRLIGPYNGYDSNVDPSVANEFTTAAYRFGHGMILEQYSRLAENGPISAGPFPFGEGVFKSQKLLFEGGIDPVLRGLWSTAVKRPHRMTPAITERLFSTTDLGSLNIMRGRDHGIPSYNKLRRFCGLNSVSSFDGLSDHITDPSVRSILSSNYASPDDIDLYVGGMVEDPVVGGLVGPTIACIIGDQFKRSRDGDRFYFENPGVFTDAQVAELKKTSLSRVLCDNGDRITEVPSQAFLLPFAGGTSSCASVVHLDLTKWREQ